MNVLGLGACRGGEGGGFFAMLFEGQACIQPRAKEGGS
jgi:hypothetical protein